MKKELTVLLAGVVLISFMIGGINATAAPYPDRPIEVINPWGAGGLTDNMLMVIKTVAGKYFGQPIIVSIKSGATATIGHKFIADAKPDGYTLIMTSTGPRAVAPHFRKVPYDPLNDFTDICRIALLSHLFSVRADFPAKDFKGFMEYVKKNPNTVKVGQPGTDGIAYLVYKSLVSEGKLEMLNVPFKSTGESVTAAAGGKIDAVIASATAIRPMVEAGKLRPLASCGSNRSTLYSNIGTFEEYGISAAHDDSYGLSGPKNLPPEIVNFIESRVIEMMKDPQVIQSFDKLGVPLGFLKSSDFHRIVEKDYKLYKKLIVGE
jgi:tripartite-type tricarboxylate transporter receptor subunit TctC